MKTFVVVVVVCARDGRGNMAMFEFYVQWSDGKTQLVLKTNEVLQLVL